MMIVFTYNYTLYIITKKFEFKKKIIKNNKNNKKFIL